MKRILGSALILLAACAFVFAEDDNEQGGDIEGTEELHQEIILSATTNAPPGATGKAELEADDEDGVVTARLQVETQGLLPGTYSVGVARKSDGSSVTLGTFEVGVSSNDDEQADDDVGDDNQGDNNDQDDGEVDVEFGSDNGLPLPADLSAMDIANVSIADANGNVVLTGDFMDVAQTMKAFFRAKVAAVGGVAAPDATGLARVQSQVRGGVRVTKFNLNAKGIAPDATLRLKINGIEFGTVTSDQHGKLHLKALPSGMDAESLIRMEFDKPDDTSAFTISF